MIQSPPQERREKAVILLKTCMPKENVTFRSVSRHEKPLGFILMGALSCHRAQAHYDEII